MSASRTDLDTDLRLMVLLAEAFSISKRRTTAPQGARSAFGSSARFAPLAERPGGSVSASFTRSSSYDEAVSCTVLSGYRELASRLTVAIGRAQGANAGPGPVGRPPNAQLATNCEWKPKRGPARIARAGHCHRKLPLSSIPSPEPRYCCINVLLSKIPTDTSQQPSSIE